MDARLQQRVQRYGWDKAADIYDELWREQLAPAQELLLEVADLQPGEQVLDIACGTGMVTLPAARAVAPGGTVTGTDISEQMIREVSARAEREGVSNVSFERMEAEHLKLEDASFDVVLCSLGIMYVTDFPGSVREMFRVLKPGGRAVAAVWGHRDKCGWASIFEIVDKRVSTDVCPMFFHPGTGSTLADHYKQAGFESVTEHRISSTLHYDDAETVCQASFAGGPVAMAFSRFDEQTRREAFREYLDSLSDYRNGDGYAIPGEFLVVQGKK